jgi:alpha-L-fucosidase
VRGYNWFLPGWNQFGKQVDEEAVERGRREGWDLFDPAWSDLYWNSVVGADYDQFLALWVAKLVEVMDRYRPDLCWFDSGEFLGGPYEFHTLEILAHYFNRSVEWGKTVCVLNKMAPNLRHNFPPEFGVLNYEGGRSRDGTIVRPWNDDLKIGDQSWGYVDGQVYLSGKEILHNLVDRVSRGGSLMLSLSPMADGTIPEGQQRSLREVGVWLASYGEAIYRTRAWVVHGEGDDARLIDRSGKHVRWDLSGCTAADVRYTRSADGKAIYAMTLGWPGEEVVFASLGTDAGLLEGAIGSVRLLGGGPAIWKRAERGLVIDLAGVEPSSDAVAVWRIDL